MVINQGSACSTPGPHRWGFSTESSCSSSCEINRCIKQGKAVMHGVAMRLQQAPYESRSLRHVRYDGRAQLVFTFLRKSQCWAEQRCGKIPCRVDSLGLGHWKEMSQRGLLVKFTGQKPGCAAFCRTGVFFLYLTMILFLPFLVPKRIGGGSLFYSHSYSLFSYLQLTFMIAATYNFAVLKLMGRGTKFWYPVEIFLSLIARL